ncbi:MAG TPA: nuclear transport factor 2 family protein [Blastococcus sp.]|jgi:predicted SnoaL-like aldol condensation-catalyzing enzyme|nr:nuclear transport factor 2 family protein [Blastococcus sp.]
MNATISKLREAMNAHDAERMAAWFAPDYRSEQPVHPNRGYSGRDTMTTIWAELHQAVPDMVCDVVASVSDGATAWAEWHWHGHYSDGSPFEMRGVTIADLTDDGLVAAQRLYVEQVEHDGPGIEESERQLRQPAR